MTNSITACHVKFTLFCFRYAGAGMTSAGVTRVSGERTDTSSTEPPSTGCRARLLDTETSSDKRRVKIKRYRLREAPSMTTVRTCRTSLKKTDKGEMHSKLASHKCEDLFAFRLNCWHAFRCRRCWCRCRCRCGCQGCTTKRQGRR